jgi:hypothetical protein
MQHQGATDRALRIRRLARTSAFEVLTIVLAPTRCSYPEEGQLRAQSCRRCLLVGKIVGLIRRNSHRLLFLERSNLSGLAADTF